MTSYILEFKHFPNIIGNPIIIDENTLFFKAYSIKHKSLKKNRPSFFGEIDNATKYLKSDRKLGIFSTKKKLKLLDIRYIIYIINDLILLRKNNDFETIIKGYMTLALSFGLVSLYKQLNLYKMKYSTILDSDLRYKKICKYYNDYERCDNITDKEIFQNPIELQGIRIGEVNNDVDSTIILREIFKDFFDGIISPTIFSPYFDENFIPNEILLFNPIDCLIELDSLPTNIVTQNITEIIRDNGIDLFTIPYFMKNNEVTHFQFGGSKNKSIDYVFEKNKLINDSSRNILELKRQGKEFRKNIKNNSINFQKINKDDYMFNRNDLIIKNNNK